MPGGEGVHQPQLLRQEVAIVQTGKAIRRRLSLCGLEHASGREAERHAVGGAADDGDVEERFAVGLEKERAHRVAPGDER